MGRSSKRFNWKAREVKQSVIDNSDTNKIKLELVSNDTKGLDAANPLVLPSKKRKTRSKKNVAQATKILSKKQRKRLEKILEKKKKKENRVQLLKSLSDVQAEPQVLSELTSIATVQTKGLKRLNNDNESSVRSDKKYQQKSNKSELTVPTNSISGNSRKRKLLLKLESEVDRSKHKCTDPNVVGFEESDESTDSDESKHEQEECDDGNENLHSDLEVSKSCEPHSPNIVKSGSKSEKENETRVNSEVLNKPLPPDLVSEPHLNSSNLLKTGPMLAATESSNGKNFKGSAPKILKEKSRPAVFVPVNRRNNIQEARLKLPVLAEEQVIMEAVSENQVILVAGETGSGKTTQVPQFLYEAGYSRDGKLIGITEPRRVAAISMAKRVAEEMNLSPREVSYLIRFEGNVNDNTQIKFMTDGVLLKEIQNDFLLTKYSVIILDEAHERSVYTDILIGLLSRIVPLRMKKKNPLKLIIMSATLRLEDFTENPRLFREKPPVVKVETRQFPVTIHFNKRTNPDYCSEAFRKACKIHTRLPEGGILIFLTGQQEVKSLVRKLQRTFPLKSGFKYQAVKNVHKNDSEEIENVEDIELDMDRAIFKAKNQFKKKKTGTSLPSVDLDKYSVMPGDDTEADLFGEDDHFTSDSEDDPDSNENGIGAASQPLWVLPMYSVLPSHEQAKVFQIPPDGCRLCVVATNVAETSITIPNVTYVIDCGKWKSRMYDKVTGVSSFNVEWCSKASANQRAGRAGRTGPGHCYRLYSSAVFNDLFPLYTTPEIQRKPVDDLVLQMKAMNIRKVANFPFPTAPDLLQIKAAEFRLRVLGALLPSPTSSNDDCSGEISPLGKAMASFPVAPRFAKMLALSDQHNLLALTVCLVAALSVQEVLLEVPVQGNSGNDEASGLRLKLSATRRKWAGTGDTLMLGDPMVLLCAVGASEYAAARGNLTDFCNKNGLRHKAIVEIRKLRVQLTNEVNLNVPDVNLCVDPEMPPPSPLQAKLLRQVMLSGLVDQVARRVDPEDIKETEDKRKWKYAYQTPDMDDPVFMHSSSVLRRKELPKWVVYQEIYETNKMYMRGITAIEPEWLPVFASELCNISDPVLEPPPRYDSQSERLLCHVSCTFGRSGWPLPVVEIDFPASLNRYKWFARFFLDGSICPKLSKFVDCLLSTPSIMTKSWAHLQPRTERFLEELVSKKVDSQEKLHEMWQKNPKYLLKEYKLWLPESAHLSAVSIWPPV